MPDRLGMRCSCGPGDVCSIFDGDITDDRWSTVGGTFNTPGITLPNASSTATLDTLLDAGGTVSVLIESASVTGTAANVDLPSRFDMQVSIGATLWAKFIVIPDGGGFATYRVELHDGLLFEITAAVPLNDLDIVLDVVEVDNGGVNEWCVNATIGSQGATRYYESALIVADDQIELSPISVSVDVPSAVIKYGQSDAKPTCDAVTCLPGCTEYVDDSRVTGASIVISGFTDSVSNYQYFEGDNGLGVIMVTEYTSETTGYASLNGTYLFPVKDNPAFPNKPNCWVGPSVLAATMSRTIYKRTYEKGTSPPAYSVDVSGTVDTYLHPDGFLHTSTVGGLTELQTGFTSEGLIQFLFNAVFTDWFIKSGINFNVAGNRLLGGLICGTKTTSADKKTATIATAATDDACTDVAAQVGATIVCEFTF